VIAAAMEEEGDRVPARFARGCRCFAVTDASDVVAYGWVSTGPEWIGELSLEVTPTRGEAYVWNCVTLAPHRRRGMYRALLEGIVSRARAEGIARIWIGSAEDPAEKADTDAGFAPVLHLTATRLGPLRWLRAVAAPAADAELAEEARQRLGLRSWSALGRARARIH
jgi:GNAT superfamily N-acetyltransferase